MQYAGKWILRVGSFVVATLTVSASVQSAPITLHIVSGSSSLSLSGTVLNSIPIEEQSPGSLTTQLQGTLTVDLDDVGGTITIGDIALQAQPQAGPFQPGNLPAVLAGMAQLDLGGSLYTGYQIFTALSTTSGSSGPIPVVGTNFSTADLSLQITTTNSYSVPPLFSGGPFTGSFGIVTDNIGTVGSIGTLDGQPLITIPFQAQTSGSANGITELLTISGVLVATVPEPNAASLLLAGALVCGAAMAGSMMNRSRRARIRLP